MGDSKNIFDGMFEMIEKNAANSIVVNEGDYELDGLLHCVNCHTPKQVRVEIFGQTRTPFCLCKCAADARRKEEEEVKRREYRDRINRMRTKGFPESNMLDWTFANDDGANPKISKIALSYVENFDKMLDLGKGLLLFGTVGTGKTYFAACICNALIDRGIPCLMTNFSRLVNTISGMYEGKQDYIDSLNRYKLIVIDDFASERNTEYMNEIIMNVIDSRYRAGLPTIITTNLTADEIKNPVEIHKQRVMSRLLEMCVSVQVEGKDRRRQKYKADYDELSDLLGIKE